MYRTFHKLQPSTNPALASKKPLLTKSPKPKLTDSAFADFGNSPQVPLALWHQKSHVFPKTVSQSPNSACAEFGNQTAGSIGVRSTARRKRANYPRILLCRILGFWHKAVAQETAVPVPKRSCRPSDSEWRHPGAVAKVSLILSHKDLPGLEHKPPAMRKPNQDSSIKFRRTVPEFGESRILEFCAFAEKNAVS